MATAAYLRRILGVGIFAAAQAIAIAISIIIAIVVQAQAQAQPDASAEPQLKLKINVYDGPTDCAISRKTKVGDRLGIHYIGTIDASSQTGEPGTKFDSSRDRGIYAYLDITLGMGDLIEGWDVGLLGLCEGAKAILVVPPSMGYGDQGAGGIIPGGATLRFDIEIVYANGPLPVPNLFDELDADGDGLLTPGEILVHFRKEGPDAALPPDLMEKEDTNRDGVVSREEFGGPKMPYEMCLEMLHRNVHDEEEYAHAHTTMELAVQWICQRPRGLEDGDNGIDTEKDHTNDNDNNDNSDGEL